MIKQARICDKCGSLIEIIEPWNEPWTGEDVCKDCRREKFSSNYQWPVYTRKTELEVLKRWKENLEESDIRKKKDKFRIEKYD